jgi:hypothetical protein
MTDAPAEWLQHMQQQKGLSEAAALEAWTLLDAKQRRNAMTAARRNKERRAAGKRQRVHRHLSNMFTHYHTEHQTFHVSHVVD